MIGFHGARAEVQSFRDLARRPARSHQPEDLQLAIGKPLDGRSFEVRVSPSGSLEDALGQGLAETEPIATERTDRLNDGAGGGLLANEAARAGAQSAPPVHAFVVHGRDDGLGVGMSLPDPFDEIQPVAVLEHEIDDHDVGC
ncbi:MAG: hypothetical protein USCGTAYLOR_00882 [Chromatiales bacterium USCg_Taylor]|nr:MAG: hypothetical protein USCGTAYLOR_00882 [Chromatiales bacterium USCg_Taylor]